MANCIVCKKPAVTGLVIDNECFEAMKNKFALYEQAERDGRLVILPCKPGETFYIARHGEVVEDKVRVVFMKKEKNEILIRGLHYDSDAPNFLDTVFLTYDEAEAALAKMKDEADDETVDG